MKIEDLSKKYIITHQGGGRGYKTLREELTRWFRKTGSIVLSRSGQDASSREEFWALREISFDVNQGDRIGIIGRNGAGKSTLLKIMSRITEPTTGRISISGRVASLLEVGTGFHPELTGRENIFLNGAILGMAKTEIRAKFDEIIDFAEVEQFLDTPVKRYSSGMYVRLAFAVAAHLEPEILLIDEVLAVGDASFQKKCLGKMEDVSRQEGRTIFFVSHNMGAINSLCDHAILLDRGKLVASGATSEITNRYLSSTVSSMSSKKFETDPSKKAQFMSVQLLDSRRKPATEFDRQKPFYLVIEFTIRNKLDGALVGVMLDRADNTAILHAADIDAAKNREIDRKPGIYRSIVKFPGGILNAAAYQIRLCIQKYGGTVYDYFEGLDITLIDTGTFASLGIQGKQRPGAIAFLLDWDTKKID